MAHLLPPELSSSAQGLLAGLQWGFGAAVGSLFGGVLQTAFGWRVMWRIGAGLSAAGLLLMCWEMRREGARAASAQVLEEEEEEEGSGGGGGGETRSGDNTPLSASAAPRRERFSDADARDMVSTVPVAAHR